MRPPSGVAALVVLALSLVASRSADAQEWTVDLYGGHVAYELATSNLAETSALLGVRYRDPERRWLYLTTGIPFGSDDSLWGAAGLGTRLATDVGSFGLGAGQLGSLQVGADLAGQGFVYRDPSTSSVGAGGVLDVRPLAALVGERARLEVRSGWVGYRNAIESVSVTRGVHDSDVSLHLSPTSTVGLSGTVRHVRATEGSYTFGGGRLTIQSGAVRLWGSVGAWTSDALPTTEWGAGISYRLDPAGRTVLAASVREDATDPLYWNSPRERWSVGVSRTLGGGDGASALPDAERSTLSPDITDGRVRIRIPEAAARTAIGSESSPNDPSGADRAGDPSALDAPPSIAGDFTDWEPIPMEEDGDHWTAVFQLEPGVYRYAFRAPGGEWFVPESVPGRRPDGFGGYVAVLVVE
ncbi:MAG: glycogen-binding domain-containing protein [Gemmatimonadota bacterium]